MRNVLRACAEKLTIASLICTARNHSSKKQGIALTGRNRTGPPWSVGRPTADALGGRRADRPRALRLAGPPAGSLADSDR